MICAGCEWDRAVERACMQGRALPTPAAHSCGPRLLRIGYLTAERFAATVQVTTPTTHTWPEFRAWLTHPTVDDDKRAAGAWTPCDLPGGRVNEGKGPVCLLAFDVDAAGPDGIERSAVACSASEGVVVPSANATIENTKHRAVLTLSRDLTAEEYPIAWAKCASDLELAGIVVDKACKNINRLWFGPVVKPGATWLGARVLTGDPIDVDRMLEIAREEEEQRRRDREARAARVRPVNEEHVDAYIGGAIDGERRKILRANEGGRHDALLRAVFALSRFPQLTEADIANALLEPFVAIAGENRRAEAVRAIRDAHRARTRLAS